MASVQGGTGIIWTDERGAISLTELLVTLVVLLLVFMSAISLYQLTAREQVRVTNRVQGLDQQQIGMERMIRELRGANIYYSDDNGVEAEVKKRDGSTDYYVKYRCDAPVDATASPPRFACTRQKASTDDFTAADAVPVVTDVDLSTPGPAGRVFTVDDPLNPKYIGVNIQVRPEGAFKPIVLQDGFQLRGTSAV